MIPGRLLQRGAARGRGERRHHPAVPVDDAHDRQADLVARTPSSRSRGTPGRSRGTARSRRRTPPSARGSRRARRGRRRSDASAAARAISRSSTRRTTIRSSSSDRSWSYSSAIRSTTGSRRFHASRGWTVVPRPCSTRTSPRSSSSFSPSRMTVRLKPNCSQSAGSVGRTSSSANAAADDLLRQLLDDDRGETGRPPRRAALARPDAPARRIERNSSATETSYVLGVTVAPQVQGRARDSAARRPLSSPCRRQAARDTVDAAWALGVRFFDTAPLYGSGLAEERLGQALAGRPRRRVHDLDEGRARASARQGEPGVPRRAAARADLRLQPRGHSPLARREPRAAPARRRRHRAPPRSRGPHGRGAARDRDRA